MSELRRHIMMQQDTDIPYIQDGLVFYVDCKYYKNNNKIVDKISGAVFENISNKKVVKNTDGGILFDGIASFTNYDNLDDVFYYKNHTFEACFENYNEKFNLFGCNVNYIGFRFGTYGSYFGDVYGILIKRTPWDKTTKKRTMSIVPEIDQYDNLVYSLATSKDHTSGKTKRNYIGFEGGTFRPTFKGVIYNLRIYNRVLSKEERTYNAMVDNERFNLGL